MCYSITRLLAFSALGLCVFTYLPGAVPAMAAEEERHFRIPAQPMASALIMFSEQAELQILVASSLVADRSSRFVSGRYTPLDALSRLIGAEPLVYRYVAERTIAITRREAHLVEVESLSEDPIRIEQWSTGTQ